MDRLLNDVWGSLFVEQHAAVPGEISKDADDVDPVRSRLLDGALAEYRCGNLAGKGLHGDPVRIGCGKTGDQVCGAGTRGGTADTESARNPCIPVGNKGRPLFMLRNDRFNPAAVVQGGIKILDRSSGNAE